MNAVLAPELDKVLEVGRDVDPAVGGRLERDSVEERSLLLLSYQKRAGDWLKLKGFLHSQGRDI